MLRSILIAAVLAAASTMPVYAAATVKCDDASIMALQTKVDAMTDQTKKTAATKQVTMAKDAMKAHKMKNCVTHMENAEKGMSKM
ncbi:hypothetical protein ACXHXG_17910 [Rhizobium sp. LEGMi198b]|uniref:hypothetical protein n=1 Tax=unclassified Rhizobium TaxID=2613769 RepID=UPI000CDF424F|nr:MULTISPECIES: hypothetical protein [Rhizobium]AVA23445.1 hypothetical protein NXC24_CH03834 [Rhizobium sp. NXC24]MDK4739561.1 hypothetical protein [Rhizobium sp. CNPSo 3464]UWU20792.1 hypothetical protein N2601_16180 [Rhizobium tropici]